MKAAQACVIRQKYITPTFHSRGEVNSIQSFDPMCGANDGSSIVYCGRKWDHSDIG
jgi:hypothetical protein